MATHSSVLAWRIPGTLEPGGLPSMGSHRVGHDGSDLAAATCIHGVTLQLRILRSEKTPTQLTLGRRGTWGRATAIRALMRSGAQERKGQHGRKGPCPGPRGLSPKPAGARRGCPGAPGLATLVITGASALSSYDSGKRTHECSKLSSPTAPRTPSPAELGLNPPKEEPASERGNRRKGTQHRSSL